jgi:hypothetical protein
VYQCKSKRNRHMLVGPLLTISGVLAKVREIGRIKGGDRMNEACLDLQKAGELEWIPYQDYHC